MTCRNILSKHALALAAAATMGMSTLAWSQSAGTQDPTMNGNHGQLNTPGQTTDGQMSNDANHVGTMMDRGTEQSAIRAANDPDKLFLVNSSIDNQAEVRLADLADQKSQDSQVKQVAQRIKQDHQQAEKKLEEVAKQAGVEVPQSLPLMKQQTAKVLESLNGKDFDQAFISHMRAGHAMAVLCYQDEAQLGKNDAIKQYASETLPTLKEHCRAIDQVASSLGLPEKMDDHSNTAQPAGAKMNGDMNNTTGGATSNTPNQNR